MINVPVIAESIAISMLASLVIIQEAECLQDLVLWVPVQDFVGDHLEELFKANGAAANVVDI